MGLLYTLGGGAAGLGLKWWTNSVRKVPLRRDPWEYVLYAAAGAALFRQIPIWEKNLTEQVNTKRAARNLPPINREGATTMFGG
ncbi:hypothetical protein JKP88DRAFT_230469 [Tribonema minus]|uniref:Uncharacterized protein n=1 Tax=Tribonema minus TaxID=303371 RepID=A0A835ZFJ2_9STRA|nr:hypothetical protein JKP88DRAFT_230469 [Tribonema minus]